MKHSNHRGSETQFPGKLHDLMEYVERQGLDSVISWIMGGCAFKIHDAKNIVDILPLFFGLTKYRSLLRQINMWHFDKILDGPEKGGYFHPYFVKGNKALCSKMSRKLIDKPESPKNLKALSKLKMSKKFKRKQPLTSDKTMTLSKLMQNLDNIQSSCSDETDVFAVALHAPDIITSTENYNNKRAENVLTSAAIDLDSHNSDLLDGFAGRSFFPVDDTEHRSLHGNHEAQASPIDLNMTSKFKFLPSTFLSIDMKNPSTFHPIDMKNPSTFHPIDMKNTALSSFGYCTPRHTDRKANQLAFPVENMCTDVEREPYHELFADDDSSLSYPVDF
jgi:hypothetical protein